MPSSALHKRLVRLPRVEACGIVVPVACGFRSRLLGLAGVDRDEAGAGLLIPRCSSVHTFGMRFPLLLAFLDETGAPLSLLIAPPRRFAQLRGATAVLELPFGTPTCRPRNRGRGPSGP